MFDSPGESFAEPDATRTRPGTGAGQLGQRHRSIPTYPLWFSIHGEQLMGVYRVGPPEAGQGRCRRLVHTCVCSLVPINLLLRWDGRPFSCFSSGVWF